MSHNEVYLEFKKRFSQYEKQTKEWFQNGRNSIRVRLLDGSQYVFTFVNKNNFKFETMNSFMTTFNIKKEK